MSVDLDAARRAAADHHLRDTVATLEELLSWQTRQLVRLDETLQELERVVGVLIVVLERLSDETHPLYIGPR
jgi:hypothetical protein